MFFKPLGRSIFAAHSRKLIAMTEETKARIEFWLSDVFDNETHDQISELQKNDPKILEDSFYKSLDFGTGGLRGEMGVGSNRMNKYTVGMATQGLADYISDQFSGPSKVAIAYDSRNRSPEFARTAAEILSANGIQVYLYDELRPTPLLSFTVRELSCQAGIVITASHNPKEYNGYKVYWNDGGQLVPPHDKGVIEKVRLVDSPAKVDRDARENLILPVPAHVEEKYYSAVKGLSLLSENSEAKKTLSIVYTSLHGTGITMIPQALEHAGFTNVTILESQREPDGNFPTVESPNPEESTAMAQAIEKAEELGADLILGTDPDTDRVGMGIRNSMGKMELINGNQAAALLLHFLLENKSDEDKEKGFIAKTVVTSDLLSKIAEAHQVPCYETLTGFKYIAELIRLKEGEAEFIGGGEESYGYLVGDFVRDKDAVISSVMLCEMAAWARERGMKVAELLNEVYERYGLYRETLVSLVKKGMDGAAEIASIMTRYREDIPKDIAGVKVVAVADYKNSEMVDLDSNEKSRIDLPASNVLQFFLEDGSKITARPSGTEPKIKYYISVKQTLNNGVSDSWTSAGKRIEDFKTALGI